MDGGRRGYPHERGNAADRAHRRGGEAPAYRPEPERPGGAGHADVREGCLPGNGKHAGRAAGNAAGDRAGQPAHDHARLYPHAEGAADHPGAPYDGLCPDVPAGQEPLPQCLRGGGRDGAGLRRAGRHDLSPEPGAGRGDPGLQPDFGKQPGRRGGPGLYAGLPVRGFHLHDAPEPLLRGTDPVEHE